MISIIILSLIVSIQCSHLYGLAGRTLNGPIGIISGYHREFKPLKNVKGFEPQFISTINSTHFAMVNSTGIDAYCLVLVKVVDAQATAKYCFNALNHKKWSGFSPSFSGYDETTKTVYFAASEYGSNNGIYAWDLKTHTVTTVVTYPDPVFFSAVYSPKDAMFYLFTFCVPANCHNFQQVDCRNKQIVNSHHVKNLMFLSYDNQHQQLYGWYWPVASGSPAVLAKLNPNTGEFGSSLYTTPKSFDDVIGNWAIIHDGKAYLSGASKQFLTVDLTPPHRGVMVNTTNDKYPYIGGFFIAQ